jgi:hypothetical protein
MKKKLLFCLGAAVFLAVAPARGQFTAAELAARPDWESFLREAEIVDRMQMEREEGVTRPWKLTLRRGEVVRYALWKDASGIRGGFWEGWKYEIAAYLLDKRLGVGMVPPTVEKALDGRPGSCQLWIENTSLYGEMLADRQGLESFRSEGWKRAGYVAQLFDDIVGNEDRHTRNVLVTADFRAILIDHSRTFRTMKSFVEGVPFSDKNVPPANLLRKLPRGLVQSVRELSDGGLREAVGDLLSEEEIRAVLSRREILLLEIGKVFGRFGEADVLY